MTPPLRHDREIHHVLLSPDGRVLLTVEWDGRGKRARLWDIPSGRPVAGPLEIRLVVPEHCDMLYRPGTRELFVASSPSSGPTTPS